VSTRFGAEAGNSAVNRPKRRASIWRGEKYAGKGLSLVTRERPFPLLEFANTNLVCQYSSCVSNNVKRVTSAALADLPSTFSENWARKITYCKIRT